MNPKKIFRPRVLKVVCIPVLLSQVAQALLREQLHRLPHMHQCSYYTKKQMGLQVLFVIFMAFSKSGLCHPEGAFVCDRRVSDTAR